MADFETAITVVLEHEGGIGNLRGDPGGETCFGWSSAECERWGIPLPRTPQEAMTLYELHFWNPLYGQILSQDVGTKILDDCVNQGPEAATHNLQAALCAAGSIVERDGIFGPATLTATNLVPKRLLLPWMRLIQYQSYEKWIGSNSDREKLREGLANRAAWPDPDGTIAPALIAGTYNATQ